MIICSSAHYVLIVRWALLLLSSVWKFKPLGSCTAFLSVGQFCSGLERAVAHECALMDFDIADVWRTTMDFSIFTCTCVGWCFKSIRTVHCYLLLVCGLAAGSSIGLTLYVQFWAPDDEWKTRLKHAERLTEINKLLNVASCWMYCANILAMHGPRDVKVSSRVSE